ncbi:hypothetical protein HSX11_20760 [Oxalobacteraceae bacterium]|nr:hypothetical protein [Oxalobacteraceae bacterium]
MNSTMKKFAPIAIITVLAIAALHSIDTGNMHVNVDGDEFDGPIGAILGTLFAGGGLLIAAVVLTGVMALLGLLFAGLGILMVLGLGLLAVVLMACISPLLLPLLIPIGLYWFFSSRKQHKQMKDQAV